jgi:hypothetical protein
MIGNGRLLEVRRGRHGNFDGGKALKFLEVMGFPSWYSQGYKK